MVTLGDTRNAQALQGAVIGTLVQHWRPLGSPRDTLVSMEVPVGRVRDPHKSTDPDGEDPHDTLRSLW